MMTIREYIKKNKKPLFIETKFGEKIAIVLSEEAKLYYQKRGFLAFTLQDVLNLTENIESIEEGRERIRTVIEAMKEFKGTIKT